ncbi:MAG: dUTP diphosphatase [Erysipelotrichaceae bacterium]|nr:dUTP diphosphatase [Erysipelotrichaceae bacterium]
MEIIKFTRLRDNAIIPTKGSKEAAGFDLYACLDAPVTITPGETRLIGTGLAFELPKNTFAGIFARSGLATKKGLAPANKVGVCDSDYRGEYLVGLHNHSSAPATVHHGDRIAQMVIIPYLEVTLTEDDLSDTDRGSGGFGSTGV